MRLENVVKKKSMKKNLVIKRSPVKNKKYRVVLPSGKKVDFGAKGYRIKPGTVAGDSYCARSSGIRGSADINSPNYWSRQAWSCKGKKSVSKKPF